MQSAGQYGVPEVPQFVVGRPPPAHIFTLSHEMSLSPSSGHGHPGHHSQHPQHHHPHQQQQHHHHHPQHPAHQPHPSHSQHQQQQPSSHAQHQHQQHQQHQVQHQQLQHQQQNMVQQLGLGGPDSPEAPSPVTSRPSPNNYNKSTFPGRDPLAQDDDGIEDEGRSAGGNRWPRQETLALIKIRSEMDANFRDSGLKGPLWEDVSRKLAELGYHRSAKKCKEKFENVHKYYKKTKDGRAGRQDGKNYRFFSQLEALYGGQNSSAQGDGSVPLLLTGHGGVSRVADGNASVQRTTDHSGGGALSDSSEDDYDEPGVDADNQENQKKRKRKEGKAGISKLMFFESLVKKLTDKQEAMQRKFLESMERREQDRLVREEAWKRQEMARLTREHELRAQEHALAATRDAALVAFLQKVTGQTLQLPQIPPPPPLVTIVETPHHQHQEEPEKDATFDPNSKRWPKPEVHALIRLRSGMETRFQEAGPKGPLWEEVSTGMACLGYNRNSKRCKEKWENINKYFRKTKESNKKRPENAKTCPYFHQLDILYCKGVLGTPNSKLNKLDEQSEELLDHQVAGSHRDDSGQEQGEGEILAMLPDGGPAGASAGNGVSAHFFSTAENGSSCDRGGSKKGMQT